MLSLDENCKYNRGLCENDGEPCEAKVFVFGLPDCQNCPRGRKEAN